MSEAVQASYDLAKQGDAVLLSPACAVLIFLKVMKIGRSI